jgi:hypothetical protein
MTLRTLAIVVGVNRAARQAPLKNPENDADDQAAFLAGRCGPVAPRDVLLLKGAKATLEGVKQAFREARFRRPDCVFFFFSGHGGPTSICLSDGECDHETLAGWIREVGCQKAAVVIDACHAEAIAPKFGFDTIGAPPDESWSELFARMVPGVRLLLSSRADQYSSDGTGRNGLFTACMFHGLRSMRGDLVFRGQRYITAEAAITHASELVDRITDGKQTPLSCGPVADFPFARPSAPVVSLPRMAPEARSRSSEQPSWGPAIGAFALLALGGFALSKLPTYDSNLGRYRGSDGRFW